MELLSDSEDDEKSALQINEKFANQFQQRERLKELRRAKDVDLDVIESNEEDSESESEDEDAELLSEKVDIKIFETIAKLRKKDPKIYDKTVVWFKNSANSNADDNSEDSQKQIKVSNDKKKYKDVLREQLLSQVEGDNHENDEDDNDHNDSWRTKSAKLNYDKEQEQIRRSFLETANTLDESDLFASDPIAKKKLRRKEKDDSDKLISVISEVEQLAPVKDESEDFLNNYMKKKLWKVKPANNKSMSVTEEDEEKEEEDVDYEDDEEELDVADMFESKYNFRFEELQDKNMEQNMQVIGHARNVEGSLRRVDDRRKLQRDQRQERKEKERRQKEAELRRLKNLKREELRERLKKIGDVGGLKSLGFIDENLLDDDWDPEKHEAMMRQQFDDQYYDEEDGDFMADKNMDELVEHPEYVNDELGFDDSQYFDDNGYEEEEGDGFEQGSSNVADSHEITQMVDELYKLDYEDIVAGIPCRFKYQQVEPEDFGLDAEEILLADDNELNRFVSLKRLSAYNTGRKQKDYSKKRKRLRAEIKARMVVEVDEKDNRSKSKATSSEGKQVTEDTTNSKTQATAETTDGASKKRRRRRKRDGNDQAEPAPAVAAQEDDIAAAATAAVVVANPVHKKKKNRKEFKKRDDRKASRVEDPVAKRLALYK